MKIKIFQSKVVDRIGVIGLSLVLCAMLAQMPFAQHVYAGAAACDGSAGCTGEDGNDIPINLGSGGGGGGTSVAEPILSAAAITPTTATVGVPVTLSSLITNAVSSGGASTGAATAGAYVNDFEISRNPAVVTVIDNTGNPFGDGSLPAGANDVTWVNVISPNGTTSNNYYTYTNPSSYTDMGTTQGSSIAPGASVPTTYTYTFTSPGTYYIKVRPDSTYTYSSAGGEQVDIYTGGSTPSPWTAITVTSPSMPNLVAGATSPTSAIAGTATTFSSTITNSGNASTGASFTDLFQSATDSSGTGTTDLGTYANATLAANGTTNATLSYAFPTGGTFYMRACADKSSGSNAGVIAESNETDNCSTWTAVTVTGANLTSTTGPTASAVQGSATTLTGTVTNIGTAAEGAFPNIIQVCDANCATLNSTIAANNVSSLGASASSPITASYTPTTSGTLYYRSCANNTTSWVNTAAETNYTDNCGSWTNLMVATPLSTSCVASNAGPVAAPANITWTASPSGGTAPYTYTWGGNVSGTAQSVSQSYPSAGSYNGNVTVTDSTGSHVTVQCSPGGSSNPIVVVSCTPTFGTSTTIPSGASAPLSWSINSACAASCVGTGFSTGNAISGSSSVSPSTTSSYGLMCGAYTALPVTISVTLPGVTLTATPSRVSPPTAPNAVTLSWTSTNTTGCTITRNGGGTIGTGKNGTNVPDPTPLTTQTVYTATCTTGGSNVTGTAVVNVVPSFQEF